MDEQRREELAERNRRRAYNCPACGSPNVRELTIEEVRRHDDMFTTFRYWQCGACGRTMPGKGRKKLRGK